MREYGCLLFQTEDYSSAALLFQQAVDVYRSRLLRDPLEKAPSPATSAHTLTPSWIGRAAPVTAARSAATKVSSSSVKVHRRLVAPLGETFGAASCGGRGVCEPADVLLADVPASVAWELALAESLLARAQCLVELQQHDKAQVRTR